MKRMPLVFTLPIGLAVVGCEKDGDPDSETDENSAQSAADERTSEDQSESRKSGARACFPDDYRLPNERSIDHTHLTITTIIGNPGDAYYQVSTTDSSRHYAVYSDGSQLGEIASEESELIVNSGITSSTKRVEQRVRLTLFDGSEIGSFLYEAYESGRRIAREHLAAIECNDGRHAVISRREFERYRAQLGF